MKHVDAAFQQCVLVVKDEVCLIGGGHFDLARISRERCVLNSAQLCSQVLLCGALGGSVWISAALSAARQRQGRLGRHTIAATENTHSHHVFQKNSAPSRRFRQRMDLPFMRKLIRMAIEESTS